MKSVKSVADELYAEAAEHFGMTKEEFRRAAIIDPLIHRFYQHKYNWDPKTQEPPW